MTWLQSHPGHILDGPLAYVIASRDDTVLAEVVARRQARRVEPHLLLAELTQAEVSDLRRQYAGRAVIAPDAPMSPFCT